MDKGPEQILPNGRECPPRCPAERVFAAPSRGRVLNGLFRNAFRGIIGAIRTRALLPWTRRAGNCVQAREEKRRDMATWEMILAGIVAVLVTMWFMPGIRESMKRSKENPDQPKDWRGVLLPIVFVVLFVLLLVSII